MAFLLVRRVINFLKSIANSPLSSRLCKFKFSSSRGSASTGQDKGRFVSGRLHLSPLFICVDEFDVKACKIELVDEETWRVSSGLVDVWRGNGKEEALEMRYDFVDRGSDDNGVVSPVDLGSVDVDLDAIEDMRIHGNLFYKLEKDSKEYEEYKLDFHRRKCAKNQKDGKEKRKEILNKTGASKVEATSKKDPPKEVWKNVDRKIELLLGSDKSRDSIPWLGDSCIRKKQRTPTFNQLTTPYHEPFCLDIHVTKGSVRASIIHRATSKVVAVSHSISKDMKFDLGSTKNRGACAAVGEVLAQRALADDIHNVVSTPRKGERLEGKLQIVLKSIIDGGIGVKVKLNQKKSRRAKRLPLSAQE